MKISILNHCYFTPAHIAELKKLGEFTEHPNTTTAKDAAERAQGADVVIADIFEFPVDKAFFDSAKGLKYLCINSTGYDHMDVVAAKAAGVQVSNLPGFSTESVAEHAIALMFAVCRHIAMGNRTMHEQPFQLNPGNRAHYVYTSMNIRGKTLGVIGLGQIGARIAEMGKGLGMNVIAYNRSPKNVEGVTMVDLDKLYAESDVIVIAVAFDESLRGMIDAKALAKMKPTAVIINIARGEIINDHDISKALENKAIAGLGTDVVSDWSLENPLLKFDNVVLTPHMAFLSDESMKNMADIIVGNVRAFKEGKVRNLVSK